MGEAAGERSGAGPVAYAAADGPGYVGYLARPRVWNGAGVVIAHSAPGIGAHEREVAERLAGLGYVALAADCHGGGVTLHGPELQARMDAHVADPRALRAALDAAAAELQRQASAALGRDRVAAIGYCFGGFAVLEWARGGAEVAAVVGFHALLPTARAQEAQAIRARVLVLNATRDPYVPAAMRAAFEDQMDAAGVDWRMVLYGGTEHAFTMRDAASFSMPGIAYHSQNAARSWRAMLDLFAETVGGCA
jgi:dienelactone hydrolase